MLVRSSAMRAHRDVRACPAHSPKPRGDRAPARTYLPLALYAVGVTIAAVVLRDQINPDAVSYVRNAAYWAAGQPADAISGYWSPLLSWAIAPLLIAGMDGLHAARVVLALAGGGLVAAAGLLMRRLADTRAPDAAQLAALCLIAISAVRMATWVITPDLLLGALLLFYCAAVLSPDLLGRPVRAAVCGALAGVGFLSKPYALVFFLVHYPATVALAWLQGGRRASPGRVGLTIATGLVAFALVAGPWIATLSVQYGHPTFSTAARINHTIVGPSDRSRMHALDRLHRVPEGRIYAWERPDALPYAHWSPFESRAYLAHQVHYTLRTLGRVGRDVASFDALWITLPALILAPIHLHRRRDRGGGARAVWVLGTVCLYAVGFTLVYYERRYIEPFLWPLVVVHCLAVPWAGQAGSRRIALGASVLLLGAFGFRTLDDVVAVVDQARARVDYRALAAAAGPHTPRGPIAFAGRPSHVGLYLAYHMERPFVGWMWAPQSGRAESLEAELLKHGAVALLVDEMWPLADGFEAATRWRRRATLAYRGPADLSIYVPVGADAAPSMHDRSSALGTSGLHDEGLQPVELLGDDASVGLEITELRARAAMDLALADLDEAGPLEQCDQGLAVVDEAMLPGPEEVVDHQRRARAALVLQPRVPDGPVEVSILERAAVRAMQAEQEAQIGRRDPEPAARQQHAVHLSQHARGLGVAEVLDQVLGEDALEARRRQWEGPPRVHVDGVGASQHQIGVEPPGERVLAAAEVQAGVLRAREIAPDSARAPHEPGEPKRRREVGDRHPASPSRLHRPSPCTRLHRWMATSME